MSGQRTTPSVHHLEWRNTRMDGLIGGRMDKLAQDAQIPLVHGKCTVSTLEFQTKPLNQNIQPRPFLRAWHTAPFQFFKAY